MWSSSNGNAYNNDTSGVDGGFLNNSTNNFDSPAKKKGAAKRLQSIVPVVIRQIRDCPDEEFKLFGLPAHLLTIVGILKDYDVQSTKATYNIEDHTGQIKAIWWLENENDSDSVPNLPAVKEGSYVRVFGSLRAQDGQKILMILRIFSVEDANVLTSHLLEVIHVRLQAEAMSKNSVVKYKANNPGAALANSMSFLDDNAADNAQSGLTPVQERVFKLLQADNSAAGANRGFILTHFQSNQYREVSDAFDFLISEGHIYSTVDNDHFKPTNA